MLSAAKKYALSAVFTLLTVLPWLLISKAVYGSFFQNSMLIKIFWRSQLLAGASLFEKYLFTFNVQELDNRRVKHIYFFPLLVFTLIGYLVYQYHLTQEMKYTTSNRNNVFGYLLAALLGT